MTEQLIYSDKVFEVKIGDRVRSYSFSRLGKGNKLMSYFNHSYYEGVVVELNTSHRGSTLYCLIYADKHIIDSKEVPIPEGVREVIAPMNGVRDWLGGKFNGIQPIK